LCEDGGKKGLLGPVGGGTGAVCWLGAGLKTVGVGPPSPPVGVSNTGEFSGENTGESFGVGLRVGVGMGVSGIDALVGAGLGSGVVC
jgi:hypothetical protein